MNKGLLSKNYILTVVAATLFYTATFMANAVCGRYSVDIGASKLVAGFVACVFTLSSFFTRPLWGWIVDRKSRRLVCLAGGVLCLTSAVILIFTKTIPVLFLSRIIFGGGYSALTTAAGTVICDVVPEEKLQQAISFYGVTNVLSQAVAPAAALWLYDMGFWWVAMAVTAVTAITLLLFFFVKYNEKSYTNPKSRFTIYEKTALPAAYTIFFFALSTASINSFIPVMAQEKSISGDGWFFIVSAMFLLLTRVFNTRLTDRFGHNKIFYAGDLIYITGFIFLALTGNLLFLIVSAVLYGTGAGFIHPIVNTAAVKDCSREKRGLATGTFMMSQDLGMTIGAAVWGFVSDRFGFARVYFAVAALLLVMMYVFRRVLAGILE